MGAVAPCLIVEYRFINVQNDVLVFAVDLVCTGVVTTDVDVVILIDISLFSTTNTSSLELRRSKTCVNGLSVVRTHTSCISLKTKNGLLYLQAIHVLLTV